MNLKEQSARGVRWSGLARGSQQVLQITVAVILARLLEPKDFGVAAIAVVFTGFIGLCSEFGTGAAIIQRQDLTDDDLSSIFWVNIAVGLFATLFTIAISPLIAFLYNMAILAPLLSLMAVGFFFSSVSIVQLAILRREMDFKKISILEISSTVMGGLVAVVLAYKGFGVWSLAWQGLTTTVTTAFLVWLISRWRPGFKFYIKSIKSIMGFSLNLLGSTTVNYLSRNMDHLLIGRFLGAESLGYYTLAKRFMLYPLQNISGVVSRVLFPAFSRIQYDHKRFRDAYLKSSKYIAFVTFPIMMGLFVIAEEFVLTLFGPAWEQAIFLLKVLCIAGMAESIGTTVGQIYLAKGRTDWMFRWELLAFLTTAFAIVIGLPWGAKGVVITYTAISLARSYHGFMIPFKLIDLKIYTFVSNFKKEFLASLILFFIILLSVNIQRHLLINSAIILITNTLLGAVIYLINTLVINKNTYREIQGIILNRKST